MPPIFPEFRSSSLRAPRFVLRLVLLTLLLLTAMAWPLLPAARAHTFAPVVKAQRDKVVHINTETGGAQEAEGGQGRRFGEPFGTPEVRQGMGSGFIVSADGYIVTNNHVVEDAQRIEVLLADERRLPAKVVGVDVQTDLALIKVEAEGLPAVAFADSSRVEVGDWVLAIGNPLGLTMTVTAGIISAKGRNIFTEENVAYGEFLQTDAAINPGNSGGPLFDLEGKVVGVNSAISRRGRGIGFAVPSNLVKRIVAQLREHGRVIRGWLGVVIRELDAAQRRELALPEGARGVVVEEVMPESPARTSGLTPGDVVTRFGEEPLTRVAQLQKLVALTMPGQTVTLHGWRRGNGGAWTPLEQRVTIGHNPVTDLAGRASLLERLGVDVMNIPETLRKELSLDRDGGVLVEQVVPGGPGEDAGLRGGDIILEVNRVEIASRAALESMLGAALEGGTSGGPGKTRIIPLLVRRGRKILYLTLERAALSP